MDDIVEQIKVTDAPDSQVELSGEIPESVILQYRSNVLEKLSRTIDVPGFRKGHVPQDIAARHVGEMSVLYEIAQDALADLYPYITEKKSLDVVGRPDITITKIAPGNPIGFRIRVGIMPQITLPNYSTIAQETLKKIEVEKLEVTETELSEAEKTILLQYAAGQKNTSDSPPTEITDTIVKELGSFENVAAFRQKLRENMLKEKELRSKEKRRVAIVDALVEKTAISVPPALIDHELMVMMRDFEGTVERMGITFHDYLKKIEKTEEALRQEWYSEGKKRAALQLLLNAIANKEGVAPTEEEIQKEASHVLSHLKDADPSRVHAYIKAALTNEKVFQFLETLLQEKT